MRTRTARWPHGREGLRHEKEVTMKEWRAIEPRPLREIVDAIFCAVRGGGIGRAHRASPQASPRRRHADRWPQEVQPGQPETSPRMWQERMTVIRKTPGVCGAAACIGDSGVPVSTIVRMSEAGAGVAEMLAAYPRLTPADCAAALNYALMHRAEIDADIAWDKANP